MADSKTFVVAGPPAFKALPHWLKERGTNTCSFSGRETIDVGYDTKPESDWGGKYSWRGRVVVRHPDLFDATLEAIQSHHLSQRPNPKD